MIDIYLHLKPTNQTPLYLLFSWFLPLHQVELIKGVRTPWEEEKRQVSFMLHTIPQTDLMFSPPTATVAR